MRAYLLLSGRRATAMRGMAGTLAAVSLVAATVTVLPTTSSAAALTHQVAITSRHGGGGYTATATVPATTTTTTTPTPGSTTTTTTPVGTGTAPLLGAVGAPVGDEALSSSGFASVILSASWAAIEPEEGVFSSEALGQLQGEIDAASASGLNPSIDIGVQYAPQWIFSVGGGTQLIDQYGDIFGGSPSSGNDVPNAITDGLVRVQLGVYLAYLGSHLTGMASVRLGGGPDNELRYPSGYSGTQPGAFWFYDTSSQDRLAPGVRGWTPGTGSVAQATAFLDAYNAAITGYGHWLVRKGERDFPIGTKLELLLPGWGQRSGEVSAAEDALLVGTPDEINQGLDWQGLIPSLPTNDAVVAYSTYADATQGDTANPDPAAFIHGLLPSGVLEGGESTGNGQTDAAGETLMFTDARQWQWYAANWFFAGQAQTSAEVDQAFDAA